MSNIPNKTQQAINEFLIKINEILENKIKRIILYGSYARGDFNKSSDIDIMILTDLTDDEIVEYSEKIWDFAYDIELENNVILSILIKNIDKFNYWLEALPFYINVQNEGVVLNER